MARDGTRTGVFTQAEYGENSTMGHGRVAMEISHLPKCNTHNAEEMRERLMWYFDKCEEYNCTPIEKGIAFALNIAMRTWEEYKQGVRNNNPECREVIQWAMDYCQMVGEGKLMDTRGNCGGTIFYAKNRLGMTDLVQVQVGGTNSLALDDPDTLKKLVADIPELDEVESEEETKC